MTHGWTPPTCSLDVPALRTLFGAKQRPGRNGNPDPSPQLAVMIGTPRYDLTMFKVHPESGVSHFCGPLGRRGDHGRDGSSALSASAFHDIPVAAAVFIRP
jgi:hypothetical protein